jgi:hypothetical protein
MIIYNEFPQRSLEWHEIKWGKIGGTLSSGLLKPTETLFIDIISQIGEDFEPTDSFESLEMQRGNDLEPFAIEYLETYTGYKFNKPAWLQSEESKLIGISPDGITEDLTVSCETKCLGRKAHWECILNDQIPKKNIDQCIHYFTVNDKLKKHYFIAFRPEAPKHFVATLTRDTIVDIGLTKKSTEKRKDKNGKEKDYVITIPVLKTIQQWVEISKSNAIDLEKRIEKTLTELTF